jgi:hypothetical protein
MPFELLDFVVDVGRPLPVFAVDRLLLLGIKIVVAVISIKRKKTSCGPSWNYWHFVSPLGAIMFRQHLDHLLPQPWQCPEWKVQGLFFAFLLFGN